MRRRDFITLLGGATAWPLSVSAEQPTMRVIGFARDTSLAGFAHLTAAFRQGLTEAGFVEGQNVAIDYRSAEDQGDRLPGIIADLVRQQIALIVCNTASAHAAKAATSTVPIVFVTGGDPVRDGLVARLNRPGGNVTGVSFLNSVLAAKRLELLRQIVPKATKIAAMSENSISPDIEAERRDLLSAAQAMGQQFIILDVSSDREIETAFTTLVQRGAGALHVGTGAFMSSKRERIVALAARHRIPAIYN
jgi:putative ABC transport system substrate-binding protein